MLKRIPKTATRVGGLAIALLAGAYFLRHAYDALSETDLSTLLNLRMMAAMAAFSMLYAASILSTAQAWYLMLRNMGRPIARGHALSILAVTQFGKYLPGNVAQHFGRIALARTHGVPLSEATSSVAYELLLAIVAGVHVGALTLLWNPPPALAAMLEYRLPLLIIVTLGAIAMLILAPFGATWVIRIRSPSADADGLASRLRLDFLTAIACYLFYATGFVVVGFGLWLLATVMGAAPLPGVMFFIGAFASSWMLGFAAPGAPAGLGVREFVLNAWFSSVMSPDQAVLLVVGLRIVTTMGDLLNFIVGSIAMAKATRT